jgi:hypothetical protein
MATKKAPAAKPDKKPAKPAPKKEAAKAKRKPAKRVENFDPVPEGTPSEQADAALAKLDANLAAAKARLAPKPDAPKTPATKPPVKKQPKAKQAGTYEAMKANRSPTSSVENPVRAMWDLCDANTDKKRKDVIALAVEAGINFYTARTQYQLWLTAYRNSKPK